ncbi:MAG: DNA/RNA helicase domain-containing protein [Candidatus Woesearchaeota archaeon]
MTTKIEIKQFEFNKRSVSKIDDESLFSNFNWANNWPTIYILNNKREAYVGESYKIRSRIEQHLKNKDRQRLDKINIIVDKEANKSYTLDIESFLIRYMSADRTFNLQNGNHGLVDYNYYNKENYHDKFRKEIWPKLRELKLVKKSLKEIENSILFKFSPYTSLSSEQYDIIDSILNLFKGNSFPEKGNVIVNGGPGTGKTLLGINLIKLLNLTEENFEDNDVRNHIMQIQKFVKKIGLVIPQQSLRKTLKNVFQGIDGLDQNMILSPNEVFNDNYDLLIVDEAHRLRQRVNITNYWQYDSNNRKHGFSREATELDWILSQSKFQIFFYDRAQTIKPTDIDGDYFKKKTKNNKIDEFVLRSQFRVQAGNDYLEYIQNILNCDQTEKREFSNYDLRFFDSFSELYSQIKIKENKNGLSRLVAGYGWKWISKKKKNEYDIEIENIKLQWNTSLIDWINKPESVNEIGCIHTIQGYDLNYAGVIFGPEIDYDPETNEIIINEKKYHDRNGKASIKNKSELKKYILNIYSVLLTRGIKGTYIYVVNKNLKEYLRKYFN